MNRLKNIDRYLKKLKKDLGKLRRYDTTYGLRYLFNDCNEEEEDDYEPIEIEGAFKGGYVLYENMGDRNTRLSIDEYFEIIRSNLKDMIDNDEARNEWKIQLTMRVIFFF